MKTLDPAVASEVQGLGAQECLTLADVAEEAFDYDRALELRRAALARASNKERPQALGAFLTFVVERYGLFEEAAALIGTPGIDTFASVAIARLFSRAARESGLASAARDIDARLWREHSDVDAGVHLATLLASEGEEAKAREILAGVAVRSPDHAAARALGEALKANEDRVFKVEVDAVEAPLRLGALSAARRALEAAIGRHGASTRWSGLEDRIRAAEASVEAERLRRGIDAALDADDLVLAAADAATLAALSVAGEADRAMAMSLQRRRDARLAEAALHAGEAAEANRDLIVAAEKFIEAAALAVSAGAMKLSSWSTLYAHAMACERNPRLRAVEGRAAALGALATAEAELVRGREEASQAALAVAEATLKGFAPVDVLAEKLRARRRDRRLVEARALASEAAENEETSDLADALAKLDRAVELAGGDFDDTAARRGRAREHLRNEEQFHSTQMKVVALLQAGDVHAARRALATLQTRSPSHEEVKVALAEHVASTMGDRYTADRIDLSHGLLRRDAKIAMVACGASALLTQGRRLIVVGALGRAAAFELPDGAALRADPSPRVHERDGRYVCTGAGRSTVLRLEWADGEAPVVSDAMPWAELCAGDDTLLGAAFFPERDEAMLLTTASGRSNAGGRLTRVDTSTMRALASDRPGVPVIGLCGVTGAEDRCFVSRSLRGVRSRSQWTVALADGRGETVGGFTLDELGEPVASITRAAALPGAGRVVASYATFDPFDAAKVSDTPSLLVIRDETRLVFASSDPRRRLSPGASLVVDHAWCADPLTSRVCVAALPTEASGHSDALILVVEGASLRGVATLRLRDHTRVRALCATDGSAFGLVERAGGAIGLIRVDLEASSLGISEEALTALDVAV